jgi:hypothetical protein
MVRRATRREAHQGNKPARDNEAVAASRGTKRARKEVMWLMVLEAFGALGLLLFIVWWTMFSGRKAGERSAEDATPPGPPDDRP